MEAIEEVLKGLVARSLDGARIFATIFHRRVRVLSALRGKMWDYECGEPQEELQDPQQLRAVEVARRHDSGGDPPLHRRAVSFLVGVALQPGKRSICLLFPVLFPILPLLSVLPCSWL
jgi:hypothetical protein